MHEELTSTPYLIEFETTALFGGQTINDTIIMSAFNQAQAEALFAQDFDPALYVIISIDEWEIP